MKNLILLSLVVVSTALANPKERISHLVDTLSSAPASLTGNVSVGSDVTLGESRVQVGPLRPAASLRWRKNQQVGFYLTEEQLVLNTEGAITISVSGINIKVKSIRYQNNGHFEVDLKFPVMERTLERKIAAAVEERYKAKMDRAFRELSQIRRQRNAGDTKELVNKVVGIFKDPAGPTVFDNVSMSGNISLNFEFPAAKSLGVTDSYVADIQAGDHISVEGAFTRRGNRFTISQMDFRSQNGVIFRPASGSRLSMKSLKVTSVRISDRGIEPVMVTGAEETLTGVAQLASLIASAQGAASLGREANCDPRIPSIQAYLQTQLNGQLKPLIRQHRPALIRAGIDPDVLDALEG